MANLKDLIVQGAAKIIGPLYANVIGDLTGTASKATADASGNNIVNTYATKASLKTVATSGSYNDLTDKPTIPSAVTTDTVAGWGYTKNAGTITEIKMNGASKGTSGSVDLGTVLTAHQDISGKVNKAGDTMTGALNLANNVWNNVGDDAALGDCNASGCVGIKGLNNNTGINFVPYSGSTVQKMTINGAGMMTITNNVTAGGSLGVSDNACKMVYNSTEQALEFTFA